MASQNSYTKNLPDNYFWIPGYVGRYAMKYWLSVKDGEPILDQDVYSLIYPGNKGKPTRMSLKTVAGQKTVQLSSEYGYKSAVYVSQLRDKILRQPEFKALKQNINSREISAKKQPSCAKTSSTCYDGKSAGWMIGSRMRDCTVSFANTPAVHPTEESAYTEAERLAKAHPGREFIVVKTVRSVMVGGLTTRDL